MSSFLVAALYKFVSLPDFERLKDSLYECAVRNEVMGTILLAKEGINGTIAGPERGVRDFISFIKQDERIADLEHKESWAEENPFYRMKVRLKREIVTLGVDGVDPTQDVGTYVTPEDWNDLINDPDVVLIDTRNDYEVAIGTFKGAVNPETKSFREFPEWLERQDNTLKKTKVAMFCTGGIRCEKSTALLKARGYEDVYHLQGGILKYLETVPAEDSLWEGECFVFDERVTVNHDLAPGSYEMCFACKRPLSQEELAHKDYHIGVSCQYCIDDVSPAQKAAFEERQRQVELARKRGDQHIGKKMS